ncbi:WD40 repeat domain-containing protein [uncultured Roseibium sp.]|uniref:WD40 repeat domain-containing protein n=1 Tax=uncultured Roseibium sp. TaxID=1936171 RepID=UPI00321700C3
MTRIAASTPNGAGAEIVSPLIEATRLTFDANVTACLMLSESDLAAVSFGDGSVALIDTDTGSCLRTLELHSVACTGLVPCGAGFLSYGQDGRVVLIADPAAPEPDVIWESDGDWVEALVFNEGSETVALAVRNQVTVIDLTGEETWSCELNGCITGLCPDSLGKRIAASHYGGVSVLSVDTGNIEMALEWKGSHIGVTWSPDDRFIVTATQEKELHIWDLVTMDDYRIGGYPRKIHQMAWSADGKTLACSGTDAITAWPFVGTGPAGRMPVEIGFAFGATVSAVAAHPDETLVAGGFTSGNLLIGATGKGEALVAGARTGKPVTSLSWSEDGQCLVAGDAGGLVSVLKLPADLGIK